MLGERQLCDGFWRGILPNTVGKRNLENYRRVVNVPCRRPANPLFYSTYFGVCFRPMRGEGGGPPMRFLPNAV